MGYEYLYARPQDKISGVTTLYKGRYDMLEDAKCRRNTGRRKTGRKIS